MQYALLIASFGLATLSSASAISNVARDLSLLRLPVTAVRNAAQLSKRQDSVGLTNHAHGTTYLVNAFLGTPKQPVTVMIDTGSSSFWVNPECSTAGSTANTQFCETLPVFNWRASTTLKNEGIPMNLTYEAGDAEGTFVTDVLTIGNVAVTNQEVGIAGTSNDWAFGILGVSPIIGGTGHPQLVDNLVTEGFTKSRAFSLDLRAVNGPEGSIIFGGIDTKKYQGAFQKLPMVPAAQSPDGSDRYWVYMDSAGITKPGAQPKKYTPVGTNPQGLPVFLDSGSTIANLPSALVNQILADFPGATHIADGDVYQVDCSLTSQAGTLDFGFGDMIIHVPYSEFIWSPSANFCYLGTRINDEIFSLGDTFLRSAYVVYDQDNRNLHIAPAIECATSNLVEIGSGPNAVPSIVGGCSKTTTTSTTSTSISTTTTTTTTSKSKLATASTTVTTAAPVTTNPATTYPVTTYPVMTYPAYSASYPVGNSTASGSVSTIYSTTVYTISSCAPTITNCPYGQTTTETISQYTTICPETKTSPVVMATGSLYPVQPSGTLLPTFTGSAGKAAANVIAVVIAAVVAVIVL